MLAHSAVMGCHQPLINSLELSFGTDSDLSETNSPHYVTATSSEPEAASVNPALPIDEGSSVASSVDISQARPLSQNSIRVDFSSKPSLECGESAVWRRLEDLSCRQIQFEEDMNDSLNFLTDRLNELDTRISDTQARASDGITALQTSVKHLLLGIVKRIVSFMQSAHAPAPPGRVIKHPNLPPPIRRRPSPLQSRIGMNRARLTVPRE